MWDQKEINSYIDKDDKLLKPYNFAEGSPGLGVNTYVHKNGQKIAVINLMGNLFMRSCDNAFFKIEEVLKNLKTEDLSFIFVDFHAEATSEKMAMGHHLDGRVTAVVELILTFQQQMLQLWNMERLFKLTLECVATMIQLLAQKKRSL